MRRVILAILMIAISVGSIQANPIPWARIEYVNAFPPEIGLMCYDSLDLNGDTISTVTGTAIITNFVFPGYDEMFVFDSSNTTGFVINAEGDAVSIEDYYIEYVPFGGYGYSPPPIKGHSIRYHESILFYGYTLDFTCSEYGETDIVINEVNANCDWGPESNFIELFNRDNSALEISGWRVICDTIYEIPQNTVLEGNGFYIIDQNNFPGAFDMDCGADNIYLVRADSAIVDQVGWSSNHGANVSFMRYPDGVVDTFMWAGYMGYDDYTSCTFENGFPSRGAPNRHTSPGFVVIGTHGRNESGNVDVWWTDPVWEPLFAYSLAVRNFDHYPQDINDGDVVYQGTEQQVIDMVPPGHAAAYYTIFARNSGGGYSIPTDESRVMVVLEIIGIDQEPELPERISSLRCYPNPFNASVTINFVLTQSGSVNISVYNLRGQQVTTILNGVRSSGEHRVVWDGSDYPTGVYFMRLETGGFSKSVKMVLLK